MIFDEIVCWNNKNKINLKTCLEETKDDINVTVSFKNNFIFKLYELDNNLYLKNNLYSTEGNIKTILVKSMFDILNFLNISNFNCISNIGFLKNYNNIINKFCIENKEFDEIHNILIRYSDIKEAHIKKVDCISLYVSKLILRGAVVLYSVFNTLYVIIYKDIVLIVSDMNLLFTKVTLFQGTALRRIFIENMIVSEVTDFSWMFACCTALEYIYFDNFDTSRATLMNGMFEECYNLTTVNVDKFVTTNVVSMKHMFRSCYKLRDLNVSQWNVSNVSSFLCTFKDCCDLTFLDVSKWKLNKVKDCSCIFENCYNLVIKGLNIFKTSLSNEVVISDHWLRNSKVEVQFNDL